MQSEHRYLEVNDIFTDIETKYQSLLNEINEIKKEISDHKKNDSKLSQNDLILDRLDNIYTSDKIGDPFERKDLLDIYVEGKDRYSNLIPPGFNDEKFGDLILWFQIMDHSKKIEKPVIFVSDDRKNDWWLLKDKAHIGPLPELVQEFMYETNQNFHMYLPERFIKYAAKFINADSKYEKTIENVEKFNSGTEAILNDTVNKLKSIKSYLDLMKSTDNAGLNNEIIKYDSIVSEYNAYKQLLDIQEALGLSPFEKLLEISKGNYLNDENSDNSDNESNNEEENESDDKTED